MPMAANAAASAAQRLSSNALLVIELEQLKSSALNLYANSAPSKVDTVPAVLVSDWSGTVVSARTTTSASRSLPVHWRLPL
jgi:hypothetical protein